MTPIPTEKWSVSMSDLKEFKRVMDEERRKRAAAILPEEPEKSYTGKWKNIFFKTNGHCCTGGMTHDTEEIALKYANALERRMSETGANLKCLCGIIWKNHEHSHILQMPIGDSQ